MTIVIVFFVGFVLAVVLGQSLKINAGLCAIVIGFIIFWILVGRMGPLEPQQALLSPSPQRYFGTTRCL